VTLPDLSTFDSHLIESKINFLVQGKKLNKAALIPKPPRSPSNQLEFVVPTTESFKFFCEEIIKSFHFDPETNIDTAL
jgi:hypothetical protein